MCEGLLCNTAAHLIDNELSVLLCDSVSTKSRSLSELHVLWALCQTRINFVDQLVWCFVGFSPKRPHLFPRFSCQQQKIQKYTKTRTHGHTHYIHTNIYTFKRICTHSSIHIYMHTYCIHACTHTYTGTHIFLTFASQIPSIIHCTYIHTQIYSYIHIYTYIYIYIYKYGVCTTYMYICIYIHI